MRFLDPIYQHSCQKDYDRDCSSNCLIEIVQNDRVNIYRVYQ